MKAVFILGSPKPKGNTATILDEIERAFKEQGVDTVRYCFGECKVNYCLGCKFCYSNNGQCVHDDDVPLIINDLFTTDLVIVASPSYWGDVTGQMKVFIDRCTPYCNTKSMDYFSKANIKGVAVAVRAGKNKEENEHLVATIKHFLGHLHIPMIAHFTVEGIDTAEDLNNKPEILDNAYDFGKSILSLMEG